MQITNSPAAHIGPAATTPSAGASSARAQPGVTFTLGLVDAEDDAPGDQRRPEGIRDAAYGVAAMFDPKRRAVSGGMPRQGIGLPVGADDAAPAGKPVARDTPQAPAVTVSATAMTDEVGDTPRPYPPETDRPGDGETPTTDSIGVVAQNAPGPQEKKGVPTLPVPGHVPGRNAAHTTRDLPTDSVGKAAARAPLPAADASAGPGAAVGQVSSPTPTLLASSATKVRGTGSERGAVAPPVDESKPRQAVSDMTGRVSAKRGGASLSAPQQAPGSTIETSVRFSGSSTARPGSRLWRETAAPMALRSALRSAAHHGLGATNLTGVSRAEPVAVGRPGPTAVSGAVNASETGLVRPELRSTATPVIATRQDRDLVAALPDLKSVGSLKFGTAGAPTTPIGGGSAFSPRPSDRAVPASEGRAPAPSVDLAVGQDRAQHTVVPRRASVPAPSRMVPTDAALRKTPAQGTDASVRGLASARETASGEPALTAGETRRNDRPTVRVGPATPPGGGMERPEPATSFKPPGTLGDAVAGRSVGLWAPLSTPLDSSIPDPALPVVTEVSDPVATKAQDRPPPPQPPSPQPVTSQLAQRLATATALPTGDAPLEMTLDPPELGTIRLSVTRGTEGMVLHLQADLSETLDLLRRHGGALAEELQRHGLEHGSFSFSGGRDGHRPRPTLAPLAAIAEAPDSPPPIQPEAAPLAGRGALDLRL